MADIEARIDIVLEHQSAGTTTSPQPATAVSQLPTSTADPQTPSPTYPNTADVQPQAINTNEGDAPPSQILGSPDPLRGEKYGDPSDGVWSMYLTEAEKKDKDVTESWKGDTEGILVFTGLFSATVAAFIIESYKLLSPNPSDTTNALLTQISGQLVNISNGTPLADIVAKSSQPFKPTTSAVRVNVLWFLSLVLSLTCALSATLMQQWARRYQELARHLGAPHRRARMRAYIFDGISKFGMARAVATMPTILHISVFLFFAGLVDFLFPIDKTVSYFTLGWVAAFALAYTVLTVLPNLYLDCPYDTPLSGYTWRLSQFFVVVCLKTALGIEGLFHNSLLKLLSRVNQHVTRPDVDKWRKALRNQIKKHQQWLHEGLRKSIERNAKDAPSTAVTSALEWTLTALDEDKEIETFAARVPGFFDSRTVPDAISAILPLMTENSLTDSILGSRLYDLFNTCVPGASPLNEEERKRRLRVCLKCLCYFGRAFNRPGDSEPLPSYFPSTFASPEIIRRIQTEQDPVIHAMGLCFGTLVVTKLAADVKSNAVQINDEQLECLSAILGTESPDVRLCLAQPGVVQLASMISLALDDAAFLVADAVPSYVLDVVKRTLSVVSRALPTEEAIELPFNWPKTQTNIIGGRFHRVIASRLRNLLQTCTSGSSVLTDEVRRACLRMCLKSLWYYANAYHQFGASKQLPPSFLHVIATPENTRLIQQEEDRTSRVIGYCFEALVITKLAADINSGTVHVGDQELACLSGILGAEIHDVKVWLRLPGAIEHMGLFFLLLSEVGSMDPPMFPFPGNSMSPMDRTRSHTTTSTTDHIRRPGTSPMYHIGRTSITPMYPGAFVTPIPGTFVSPFVTPTPGTFVSPFVTPTPGAFVTPTPGTFVPPHNPTLGTTVFPYPTTFPVFPIPRSGDAEKSDVWDVVQQTFSILFHALPAATDIEHSQVGKFGGGFGSILQNWLGDLFKKYTTVTTPGSPPLTNEVRITCLKSLWYYEIACHRLRAPRSLPALDLFPIHLITPEIAHRLHSEVDPIIRVIWRCFSSLVVNRLATKFDPLGDRELAFISAIIGPGVQKTIHRPGNLKPGAAIQLVNVINLASNILGSLVVNTVPSEVQHMVRQTISTLAQAIPAEFKYLDQAGALMNIPDSTPIKSVVVSIFRDLLKTCTLRTLPLSEDDQADYLKICLESLCNLGQRLHWQRRIDSQPSGPEFLDLASSEITLHIRTEKDEACRVIGRCIEALVVNHLAARTDSTVQISDEALGRISAILGTENRDLRFLLGRLGTVELPNVFSLLFSEIDFLFSDSIPSDVLDMIEGTLIALSPAVLAELNAELMNPEPTDVSEKLPNSRHRPRSPEPVDTHPRTCLKYLWHCARAYNRLGAEMPLPSFVRITLANPGITWRTGAARDVGARVIGRCFGALIINKLVDDFKPRTSLSSGVYDAELACISSILDTRPGEILRWPQPSAVIKLLNVVSLMSGEIEILITSGIYAGIYASPTPGSPWSTPGTPYGTRQRSTPMPVDILNIVQQTINIISPDLVLGGAFAWGDLPMDQVSQLREICSKIADARPDNRFKKQTMGILDQLQQISKRLPTVEYKMRRCTSSIFSQQFVKGRSDSTTRPEYEVRRRRSKSI